ncbi:MAG: hypothetical protein ACYDHH_25980 [Solirubrobacteraceae bacterium]
MGESATAPPPPNRQGAEPNPGQQSWLANTGLSTRSQIACAWSGLGLTIVVLAGFLLLAKYLPPPTAQESAAQIAHFYASNATRIRAGLIIGFLGWTPWAALTTVITVQLARIQPRRPVLALLQFGTGIAGFVFLLLSMIILLVASFRPGRSPEITQALHDLGWFTLFITVPAFSTQALVIGIATLRSDPPVQVYPRWTGYANIWVAVLFLPVLLIPFFKTGPFSYQGLMVYWLAFVVFFLWILMLFWAIRRAAQLEAVAPDGHPTR